MTYNTIQKRSSSQIFSCKFCEVFQKKYLQSISCLTAFVFWKCFSLIVSNTCLGPPQITVSNASQDFWSKTIQRAENIQSRG